MRRRVLPTGTNEGSLSLGLSCGLGLSLTEMMRGGSHYGLGRTHDRSEVRSPVSLPGDALQLRVRVTLRGGHRHGLVVVKDLRVGVGIGLGLSLDGG